MPSLSKLQIPALVVVLLGVVLLGGVTWDLYGESQPDYRHEIYTVDDPEPDATVYNYSDLSPQGQTVFRETIESDGFLVTSESSTFQRLDYVGGDHLTVGDGIYYVSYEGQWWEVLASSDSGIPTGLALLVFGVVGGVSLGVVAIGVYGLRNERSRVAPSILVGGLTTALFLVAPTGGVNTTLIAYVVLLGVAVFVSPLVAYVVLGRTGPWARERPDDSSQSSTNGSV